MFGWTLQQVFGLTWPQFCNVSALLYKVQFQRAKNEVYFGVCAAIGGEDSQKCLMKSAGSFLKEDETKLEYTEEEYKAAEARLAEIIKKREEEERKRIEQEKNNGL